MQAMDRLRRSHARLLHALKLAVMALNTNDDCLKEQAQRTAAAAIKETKNI